MFLTPTDAVVVRQSKRDARLECMLPFPLYIGEHDKTSHSNGLKFDFLEVLRGESFSFVFKQSPSVEQFYQMFFWLNKWPDKEKWRLPNQGFEASFSFLQQFPFLLGQNQQPVSSGMPV